jgi:hypothetical protein
VEVDAIRQQAHEKIEEVGSTDLVIGILADFDQDEISTLSDGIR